MKAKAISLGVGLFALWVESAFAADTIKVGVIAAMTGPGAAWGMAAAEGPKILASEINAKGGLEVGGKKYSVEIVAYDDQYKAADAVAAYSRLVKQEGVKYVVLMSSAATMALKQTVEDDQVVTLTASYTAKAIDKDSQYMFRMYSTTTEYLPSLVNVIKQNIPERKVTLLNPNDETGWDQTGLSDKAFRDAGFTVVGKEVFERSQKDFQPILTKIINTGADVIDLGGTSPATAGLIIRQGRELGYKGAFVKTGGAGPRDIVAGAGKEAAEGMMSMLYADPANDGFKRVAAAYEKEMGHPANEIVVCFYDGVNALLAAIQKAGDPNDTAKVRAAFAQALPIKSVQGDDLTLGGPFKQQIETTVYIGALRDGVPVVVGKTR
jgi:branched-chain amino acid transport system substrate-binding protein